MLAFTGRDERNVFDVFTYDMRSGKIDRVTQGQGSNSDPAWSPDCRCWSTPPAAAACS
jgi:TolB protein